MEYGRDLPRLHVANQGFPVLFARQQDIEHMICLLTLRRHYRKADGMIFRPLSEVVEVKVPRVLPARLYGFPRLELRVQEGGEEIGRQVTGSHIDPRIFINLAAEETATVGSLLADDL